MYVALMLLAQNRLKGVSFRSSGLPACGRTRKDQE
jgi:hypothetical protein